MHFNHSHAKSSVASQSVENDEHAQIENRTCCLVEKSLTFSSLEFGETPSGSLARSRSYLCGQGASRGRQGVWRGRPERGGRRRGGGRRRFRAVASSEPRLSHLSLLAALLCYLLALQSLTSSRRLGMNDDTRLLETRARFRPSRRCRRERFESESCLIPSAALFLSSAAVVRAATCDD